jgi:hypothetical protein
MILITQDGSRGDGDPIIMVLGMVKHENIQFPHHNKKHRGKHGKMMQIPHMNVETHGNMLP